MIKCIGSDVVLNGKVVAHIVSSDLGGAAAFYLHFKSGRKLWLDESGRGQFNSLGEIAAAVSNRKNRDDIIIAAFTGCMPVTRKLRAVELGLQDLILVDQVVGSASPSLPATAMR